MYLTLQIRFKKSTMDRVEMSEPHFHGHCHTNRHKTDIEQVLRASIMKIINSFLENQREGSNWALDKIMELSIHIINYSPMKGSSFIPLPAKLAKKRPLSAYKTTIKSVSCSRR